MPIRPRTPQRQAKPGLLRHWTLWAWFAAALVLCLAGVCLWKSGRWLIHDDKFEKAGWGVVLAGESRDCERSDAAIAMFHGGKLDTLIISGCRNFKTRYNSEFMVDYYVQQGVPRDRIFEFRQDAYSTQEEARLLIRQFRLQNLDTVVIVTTSFHTARTRRIFRKLAGGYPVVLVAAAEYGVYDPNAFWSNRESLKLWFDEWIKTLFTAFELARTDPETDKSQFQGLTPDTGAAYPAEAPPGAEDSASTDSLRSPEAGADSIAGVNGLALTAAGDTSKSPAAMQEGTPEAMALDSAAAAAAKADSVRNRKDSLKAHNDSVKARLAVDKAALAEDKAAKEADRKADAKAEARPAAKEPESKRTPKAVKKPEAKKAASSKDAPKASDKKAEKARPKK